MQVIPNSEIDRMEGEQAVLDGITTGAASIGLSNSMISDYIWNCWEKAKRFKEQGAEIRILENMRQIDGQYNPDKAAEIKKIGGSEVFMMITDAKQKNASYWVQEILFQPGQRSWGIEPTPIPELPLEVKQQIAESVMQNLMMSIQQQIAMTGQEPDMAYVEQQIAIAMPNIESAVKEEILRAAKDKAKGTEQSVDDKLTEGGFYFALRKMIPNCIGHTGFLKGPINKKRRIMKVVTGQDGRLTKQVTEEVYPTWESRHPLYIYPAPGSVDVNDGYLIDRVKVTPLALQDLIGVDGYDEGEIMAVLDEAEGGKLFEWLPVDQEVADINEENSMISYDSDKIDMLEFWGTVRGSYLADWGLQVENEAFFYNVKAYLIGRHVIGIQLNDDPMGRKPFYKDSFENKDGSFWGKGLPEIIADCQGVCNAVARAIVNNSAMASGPQVERNIDRIPPHAREDTTLIPWKVWDTTSDMMSNGNAINFFQPPMVVEKLLQVYAAFSKIADEHSGVPGFAHGDPQVGGAGNTASGLQMLMGSAARGIRGLVSSLDENIIKPAIERQYVYIVDTEPNYGFICDYQIVTSGSAAALVKEQMAARRIEFMNATANPIDAQILGIEGRKYLLEETARSIQLDISRVFPPASTPPPQPAGPNDQSEKPQALDAAGSPVVGQDTRTANIPSNVPPGTQSRAEGGPVAPGQPYLVGDAPGGKPELFVPDQPGVIVPNANIKSYDFEKDLYDYPSATSAGLKPDKTGHWQSRVPGGPHEGLILKHETHPTFWMTEQGEKQAGMNMYRSLENGRIYSFPADWSIPDGYVPYGNNNINPTSNMEE